MIIVGGDCIEPTMCTSSLPKVVSGILTLIKMRIFGWEMEQRTRQFWSKCDFFRNGAADEGQQHWTGGDKTWHACGTSPSSILLYIHHPHLSTKNPHYFISPPICHTTPPFHQVSTLIHPPSPPHLHPASTPFHLSTHRSNPSPAHPHFCLFQHISAPLPMSSVPKWFSYFPIPTRIKTQVG